jgi:tRNA pseudouridine38-40 synthase
MAARVKIVVAYDGARFAGWQSQSHGNTIQDHLEHALSELTGKPLRVHGAGRTDTGVHALAQCAHFDLPVRRYEPKRLLDAINGLLPAEIRVMRCAYVSDNFHARYSASGKLYRYRLWVDDVLPPFELNRAWHLRSGVDVACLRLATARFVGKHDFAAFSGNRSKAEDDTVRTICSARVLQKGPLVIVEFSGDGFLYKMVRLLIGAAVQCAQEKIALSDIDKRLASSSGTGPRLAAPAAGLFLVRVRY